MLHVLAASIYAVTEIFQNHKGITVAVPGRRLVADRVRTGLADTLTILATVFTGHALARISTLGQAGRRGTETYRVVDD